MVFGEKLDSFDESRNDLLEFQDSAVQLILLLGKLMIEPPLYKYFPTKNYRHFVALINRIRQHGEFILI